MLNPHLYYNSRGDGHPVLEVIGGEPSEPEGRRFVPLKRSELHGAVAGPVANLRLIQVFSYTVADYPEVIEALYRFPLPGDAVVRTVKVTFGTVEITASLKAKAEAEAEYAAAKKAGRVAVLTTRVDASMLSLAVSGLQPDVPITVEVAFVQLARPAGVGWGLRVPLTLAPRYVRQDELRGGAAERNPLGVARDPGHRFVLDITIEGARHVTSPTHGLAVGEVEGAHRVRLAAGEVLPDQDLVLHWHLDPQAERPVVQVLAHAGGEQGEGTITFLAQVAPPALEPDDPLPRREIILLVDHSGSMAGPKWEAADWATEQLLRDLRPADRFALAVFHNETYWFQMQPRLHPATPEAVAQAVAWLQARTESGGTELGVALEQALAVPKGEGDAARAVLVVTDAQVTDHARLLQMADREFASHDRRRISVLCIDSAPNEALATRLAEVGGGMAQFLTSNPEEEDITTALDEVLADWTAPALTGLRLAVNRTGLRAAGRRIVEGGEPGWQALDLGDLPAGRAIWVVGQAPGPGILPQEAEDEELVVRLELGNGTGIAAATCRAGTHPELAAVFAARRIAELEQLAEMRGLTADEVEQRLLDLGYAPALQGQAGAGSRPALYRENQVQAWRTLVDDLLLRESLESGVPSRATAFVAVRQEAGAKATSVVEIANALPKGWSSDLVAAFSPAPLSPPSAPTLLRSPPAAFAALTGMTARSAPPSLITESRSKVGKKVIFSGSLQTLALPAVLLDSAADPLPEDIVLRGLELRCDAGAARSLAGEPGLVVHIFAGDLGRPRASVRLRDLVGGRRRPLNVRRQAGERVKVTLEQQGAMTDGHHPWQVELHLVWE